MMHIKPVIMKWANKTERERHTHTHTHTETEERERERERSVQLKNSIKLYFCLVKNSSILCIWFLMFYVAFALTN